MDYNYISISQKGFLRENNEDAIGVYNLDKGLLVVLCDGLGGNRGGEIASQLCVNTVHRFFTESEVRDNIEKLKMALEEANSKIVNLSDSDSRCRGMATTAEVLYLDENSASVAHIGDSRVYMLQDGKLTQITKDHSFVQKLIDEGQISQEEADNHPNKNILTMALGDKSFKGPDLVSIPLVKYGKELFLVCSDGVTGEVNNSELQEILANDDLKKIAEALSFLIEQRGAPDNFSFVLVRNS